MPWLPGLTRGLGPFLSSCFILLHASWSQDGCLTSSFPCDFKLSEEGSNEEEKGDPSMYQERARLLPKSLVEPPLGLMIWRYVMGHSSPQGRLGDIEFCLNTSLPYVISTVVRTKGRMGMKWGAGAPWHCPCTVLSCSPVCCFFLQP